MYNDEIIKNLCKTSRTKGYAHFDKRVNFKDVSTYIENAKKIETHNFYPFIKFIWK